MAKILVVDDEPWIRRVLTRMLQKDHAITTADSVDNALAESARQRFDLILCDLRLGDRPGTLLRASLAETDPCQSGRIVFMSGDESELSQLNAPCVGKPFDGPKIQRLIARCLNEWGLVCVGDCSKVCAAHR